MSSPSPITALLDVAFPPVCVACGVSTAEPPSAERDFCRACLGELPVLEGPRCRRCANPLDWSEEDADGCPACRDEPLAFDETIALGAYEGLLRHLLLLAKRRSGEAGAAAIGRLLVRHNAERIDACRAGAVVAVPSHWRRRLARGADGVVALADAVAEAGGLSRRRWLRRHRATAPQTGAPPSERRSNVRGAFSGGIPQRRRGRTVLLVDDVMTTGSTCHAAARALKKAGAGRVVAVVGARRVDRA